MQNSTLKFLISFFLLANGLVFSASAQSSSANLAAADSLFQQKRYTQSLELYRSIFAHHTYTPAMLLKMAYTEEGLGYVSNVLYYLTLYYEATQDQSVLQKMEELATRYRLEGFETDESDALFSLYFTHYNSITGVFLSILFVLVAIMVLISLRFKRKPVIAFSFVCLISVLFLLHLNVNLLRSHYAIVSTNNTYLMSAPSAGASVVSIVRDGHRVKVYGKKDVWVRAEWGGESVYIKESNLLPVHL